MNRMQAIAACALSSRLLVAALCWCGVNSAWALNFTEALDLARKNDPSYLSVQASYQAAQERSNIAFSALLPQLSISGNAAQNERKYVTQSTPETTDIQKFNSNSAQINLTQPLWRHADRIASTQAEFAARQGESQVIAAEHDLFVRFLQAWFDVMAARDNMRFTAKQSAAARRLRDQTTRATELGLASEPELEEARARYEKALADQAAAEAEEQAKIASLEQIIGPADEFTFPSLADDRLVGGMPDAPLGHWLDSAESSNPAVVAATYGVQAASEEIRKQRAGHEPTLDITGSYGRTAQGAGTTPTLQPYTNTQGTIGLQLSIPIFSGGGQSAKVREAVALREKSVQELENTRRGVRAACKQAFFGIQAGIARHTAALQSVKSARAALQVATSGQERELKTDLDVLQAAQQLYNAQRDLQNARYEILLNRIKLKAAAGQLNVKDVVALDTLFVQSARDPESLANPSLPQPASAITWVSNHE